MAVVFVTGMSGAGKSTVLAELARRGHSVVDTEYDGFVEEVALPGRPEPERLWREDRIGCVANQGAFYPRFDAVVLLTAPLDTLLARVASRPTNDFGKRDDERARILQDVAAVEPLLRAGATHEVDRRRRRGSLSGGAPAATGARPRPRLEP